MPNRKSKKTRRSRRGGFTNTINSPRPQMPTPAPPRAMSSAPPRTMSPAPARMPTPAPRSPTLATTMKGHADNLMKKFTGLFSGFQTGGKRRKTRRKRNRRSKKSRKRGRRTRRR